MKKTRTSSDSSSHRWKKKRPKPTQSEVGRCSWRQFHLSCLSTKDSTKQERSSRENTEEMEQTQDVLNADWLESPCVDGSSDEEVVVRRRKFRARNIFATKRRRKSGESSEELEVKKTRTSSNSSCRRKSNCF